MSGWRALDGLFLAAGCGAALAHALYLSAIHHPSDDAFISFRYVQNWVAGRGLVFNPGEYVMGYSNPAWVLLLAPFHALGLALPATAQVLGALLSFATLGRLYAFLGGEPGGRWPAVAALAFLAASGTAAVWMLGGLEGPLLAFALTCGTCAALRLDAASPPGAFARAGAWFALAAWTRPEGILFGAAVTAALLLRRHSRTPRLAWLLGTAGGAYALLLAGCALYYGDPLPNTYYAKVNDLSAEVLQRGIASLLGFLRAYHFAPLWILALWGVGVAGGHDRRGAIPLVALAAFAVFYVRIGGDGLEFHRMWLAALPLLALLLADAVAALLASGRRVEQGLAALAVAGVVALTLPASFRGPDVAMLRRADPLVRDFARIGRALGREPEGSVIAANNIGMLAYESDRTVIDMLGLADRSIAKRGHKQFGVPGHESFDGRYVLDREPDLIVLGTPHARPEPVRRPDELVAAYPSDRDLLRDERLLRLYRVDNLELADGRFAPVLRRRSEARRPTRESADAQRGAAERSAGARARAISEREGPAGQGAGSP